MQNDKTRLLPLVFYILGFFVFFVPITMPEILHSQVMSSTNYQIASDVIGSASATSTSSNYNLIETVGEFFATTTKSSNYGVRGGFWGAVPGVMEVAVSKLTITLGDLSMTAVKTDNVIVTVTSTVQTGYTMQVVADGALRISNGTKDIDNVADGQISSGQEEYGINTTGTDGQYNSTDTSVLTTLKTIATRSNYASGVSTTIKFKAAASDQTETGTYSQAVTLYVTANL